MFASGPQPSRNLLPGGDAGPSAGGVGNIGGQPDPGAWWDPRNWSAGGQKVFGGSQQTSSTPMRAGNPYAKSTPKAQMGGGSNTGLGTSTSQQTDKDKNDALMVQLQQLFDELNMPWDPNAPENKLLLDSIRAGTLQSANNQGIFGPYSNNMAEKAMFSAQAPLAMQKKGMAMNALGMVTGQANNVRDFNYDVAKDKYTNDMDAWKVKQSQTQGLGGLLGGGIGALGGGMIGGPAGAMAGWQLGSGLGGQIASSNGYSPPPKFSPGY